MLRIIQAAGASACLVATFATVRDIYAGRNESNVIYGLLGSMLAFVPAVGPLLGALIDTFLGWQAIFVVLGLGMAVSCMAAWRFWAETRQQQTAGIRWSELALPLKHLHFWLYTLCYSAGMGSFFVFFSVSPRVMMGRLELSQLTFSLWFATVAIAMMVTARIMGQLVPRWGTLKTLRLAMALLVLGAMLLAAGQYILPQSIAGFIVPMWLIGTGIATAVSVAPNGALRGFDHIAGTATAVYFCLGGLLLGSAGTVIIALIPGETAWPIITYSLVFSATVLGLSLVKNAQ